MKVTTSMQERETAMRHWSDRALAPADCRYLPLGGDASFRRYFRVECGENRRFMLMDSPPGKEDPAPFVEITQRLLESGVRAPRIHHADLARGFLLIEDFGDQLYLDRLDRRNADTLYRSAIDALIRIQQADRRGLPAFDAGVMLEEMHLFTDWLLGEHLGAPPDAGARRIYEDAFERIVENALAQPQTFVHRDYHSRNLIVLEDDGAPGVLDYQDAVVGPVSYDLVSLLKDCYVAWPREDVARWRRYFLERRRACTGDEFDDGVFERWFDLTGMQRHFKASGIFARLRHRDGKCGYLADVPRTLGYVVDCTARYPEFAELGAELNKVLQRLQEKAK